MMLSFTALLEGLNDLLNAEEFIQFMAHNKHSTYVEFRFLFFCIAE